MSISTKQTSDPRPDYRNENSVEEDTHSRKRRDLCGINHAQNVVKKHFATKCMSSPVHMVKVSNVHDESPIIYPQSQKSDRTHDTWYRQKAQTVQRMMISVLSTPLKNNLCLLLKI